jgi:predicted RNA-binding Zn-ribbon protein involved in translation (DUF1610 family)
MANVFLFKDEFTIAEIIQTICSIRVEAQEVYSKEVCAKCLEIVYKAHCLRILSLKNEQLLKEHDATVKTEPDPDELIKSEEEHSPKTDDEDDMMRDYSENTLDMVEVSILPTCYSNESQLSYLCDKCPEVFISKESLETHIKHEHLSTLFAKEFCNETVHEQQMHHTIKEELGCDQCNMFFKTATKLEKHQELHSYFVIENEDDRASTYSCRFCSKSFQNFTERMFKHVKHHKNYTKNKQKEKQPRQKRIREEYESLVCPHCGQIYRTKQILQQHIKRHFDTGEKYTCPKCPQKFKSWGELYYHNAVHTTERNFVCDICSKAFKAKRDLRNHKIRHEQKDVKLFVCNYCQLKLKNRYTLNRHILIHTGEVS